MSAHDQTVPANGFPRVLRPAISMSKSPRVCDCAGCQRFAEFWLATILSDAYPFATVFLCRSHAAAAFPGATSDLDCGAREVVVGRVAKS